MLLPEAAPMCKQCSMQGCRMKENADFVFQKLLLYLCKSINLLALTHIPMTPPTSFQTFVSFTWHRRWFFTCWRVKNTFVDMVWNWLKRPINRWLGVSVGDRTSLSRQLSFKTHHSRRHGTTKDRVSRSNKNCSEIDRVSIINNSCLDWPTDDLNLHDWQSLNGNSIFSPLNF